MKIHKRILSFLTSAVVSLTMTVSVLPAGAEEGSDLTTETTKDVRYTAESSLGALLLDETQTAQEDAFDGSCGITDVTVENGKASVSYYVNTACELVVGFYSDDESQMYASVSEHVTPPEENTGGNALAEFTLPDEVPEYYLVKAFLVAEDLSPLCTAYSTNLYTEEITRIRNATAADYDADLVVQLDEKTDTNFMVLSDSTVQVPYNGTSNLLSSYDEETGVYTFTAIDSSMSSLKAGDVVYYDYNGQQLVFTVASITIDGTSAVIASGDMDLTDAFSLVKIEYTSFCEVEDPDVTDMGDGLTYEGTDYENTASTQQDSMFAMASAAKFSGDVTAAKASYTWKKELYKPEDKTIGCFVGSFMGSVNLSITASVPVNWTLYVDWASSYAKIDLTPTVSIEGSVEAELSGTLYLKRAKMDLLELVGVDVGIGLTAEASGHLDLSVEISTSFSLNLGNTSENIVTMSKPDLKKKIFKPDGSLFIGVIADASGTIAGREATAEIKAGAEISRRESEPHDCKICFAGSIDLKWSGEMKYTEKALFSGKIKRSSSKTLFGGKMHLCDFYWSATFGEFGLGDCPHVSKQLAVKEVSLGGVHSAAITEDDSLYMWGDNEYGKLGIGTTANCSVPVKIMDNVKSVSLGYYHSAAITEDGSLYTWGWNNNGMLGNGTTKDSSVPVKVMDNVETVSLGDLHSAALTEDGSLYTWGCNSFGELGNGTTKDSSIPVKIMDNVKMFSFGGSHSAAITEDGSLYIWGDNQYGQFGNNTTGSSTAPIKVLDNVKAVSLGSWHSAAITEDGTLYAWGRNEDGRLGNGTTENSYVPVKIMDNVKAVSLGVFHSAAITEDGSLYTWGYNKYGLGNGTTTQSDTPVKINISAAIATKSLPPAPKPLAAAPVRTLNAAAAAPQSAELTGLTPGMVYNVYCMADPAAENPLGSENLLYINQYTADENGTIAAEFTPTREVPGAQTIAFAPQTGAYGDVDGNGQVELLDVVTLNKNLLGLVSLDTRARRLADVDQNDLVDGSDSLYILRFLVSLVESLPVQQ